MPGYQGERVATRPDACARTALRTVGGRPAHPRRDGQIEGRCMEQVNESHTMTGERWRRSDACSSGRVQSAERERFPGTSRERFPTASTVGGDLGERRLAQRFPVFADTEEVTGSNPVAPTTPHLSRDFADRLVPPRGADH